MKFGRVCMSVEMFFLDISICSSTYYFYLSETWEDARTKCHVVRYCTYLLLADTYTLFNMWLELEMQYFQLMFYNPIQESYHIMAHFYEDRYFGGYSMKHFSKRRNSFVKQGYATGMKIVCLKYK